MKSVQFEMEVFKFLILIITQIMTSANKRMNQPQS